MKMSCCAGVEIRLIKERMSALLTDAIRANLLEEAGYQVQVLEFIDMEHTPKNILLRAVKSRQTETGGGTDKDDGGTACFPNTGGTDERRKGCSRCVEEYRKF